MNPLLSSLENIFFSVLQVSWQASVLALLVLGIRALLGKRLPARWAHVLWLLVVLRLLLPILPSSPLSIHRVVPLPLDSTDLIEQPALVSTSEAASASPEMPHESIAPSWFRFCSLLWLAGVLGFGAFSIIVNWRFARRLRLDPSCRDLQILSLAQACASELGLRRSIEIKQTSLVNSPALFGIFRPILLWPAHQNFSSAETRLVLLHEFGHLKRRDHYVEALATVLHAIHWFNPILTLAFSRLRMEREAATDALVLSGSRVSLKTLYGETLLRLMESIPTHPAPSQIVGIGETAAGFKERLRGIARATADNYGRSFLGLLLLGLLAFVALTKGTAQSTAPATTVAADTSPAPQGPDFHAKDKSEIVTETRITKSVTLQATLIGMPTADAAEFSNGHDLVKEPAEALAALQRLTKENKATLISMPSLVLRAGEPVFAITTAGTTKLSVTQALVEPDGKSMKLFVIVQQDNNQMNAGLITKNGDTVFIGTISGLNNPALTEFAFLHTSVVDHETKIEKRVPTKSETDTLLGQWVNPSPGEASLTRLLISQAGSEFVIQAWSTHDGKEYDWGQAKLRLGNECAAQWGTDLGMLFIRFTKEGNQLDVEAFTSEQGKDKTRNSLVFQKGS